MLPPLLSFEEPGPKLEKGPAMQLLLLPPLLSFEEPGLQSVEVTIYLTFLECNAILSKNMNIIYKKTQFSVGALAMALF
ncbi:hypothetical protein DPMN_069177 [Dreissena polymorpha]|uniref:Uncharacterized protein n=1 Tax=Dreissena polymorpha TaxID=45954 RepID=A0A9D4BUQ7_DREPO|nr:hypothetical protein DPMN_069177 [Dreissena polymorpha]